MKITSYQVDLILVNKKSDYVWVGATGCEDLEESLW